MPSCSLNFVILQICPILSLASYEFVMWDQLFRRNTLTSAITFRSSSVRCPSTIQIWIFSTETAWITLTELRWNGTWLIPFQHLPNKMAELEFPFRIPSSDLAWQLITSDDFRFIITYWKFIKKNLTRNYFLNRWILSELYPVALLANQDGNYNWASIG